jgi:hypothetical protein
MNMKAVKESFSSLFRPIFIAGVFLTPLSGFADDNHETCRAAFESCVSSTGATMTRPERGQRPTETQMAEMEKVRACVNAKVTGCDRGPGGPRNGHRPPPPLNGSSGDSSVNQ